MRFPLAQPEPDPAYAVGDLYVTTRAGNPAALLGYGVWQAFGSGLVLVGFDAGQSEFDAVEKTGGAKDVTLTAAQSGLPQHAHVQRVNSATTGGTSGYTPDTSTNNGVNSGYSTADAGPQNAAQSHTNLQPFITVFMWKRTA
jgi:hypothetical protein